MGRGSISGLDLAGLGAPSCDWVSCGSCVLGTPLVPGLSPVLRAAACWEAAATVTLPAVPGSSPSLRGQQGHLVIFSFNVFCKPFGGAEIDFLTFLDYFFSRHLLFYMKNLYLLLGPFF